MERCLTGGHVLRPDMTVERADVLVDDESGEILGVEEGLSAPEELDASDGLVIPGLVNAHTHAAMTLLRGYADDKPLQAWLEEDIWPTEAELEPADVRAGADLALVEMIRSGTTAFADMYFEVEQTAEAVAEAGVRAVLGHTAITIGKSDADAKEDIEESVRVAQELDGYADGRVRTTVQPHSLTTVNEAGLRRCVEAADELGVALTFHANETEGEVDPIVEERGERPLAYADDCGLLREDSFFAHGVHTDESEINLVAERGASVVHCPASNMKIASGAAPVADYLEAGVNVAVATDGAATNNDLDLFDELRDAAMLAKLRERDAEAVPAETAVRMATANGADALGIDAGRVEAGRKADLAVVDLDAAHLTPRHDLVSHLAYAVRGSDVRHTLCDGDVLMRERELTTLDAEEIRARAAERAASLVERAD